MRYGKRMVYLFTLLFAVVAGALWAMEPRTQVLPVSLILTSGTEEETITCWDNGGGEYYLFLPAYADTASARLRIHGHGVTIDGKAVRDGMSCEAFALDQPYSFSFDTAEDPVSGVLTFVRSENLPALYIDSGSGSMEYIHSKKGNRESGRMRLYSPEGALSYIGNLDEIKGRGNDWLIPKKSYSLRLGADADLLEMGQAENWILLSNAFDWSHLRNKLIFDFADAAGMACSPESAWVDLYLNGEYAGVYLLCERNELHPQRVSLEGEGQYLVSMDLQWRLEQNAKPFVTTRSGQAFRIHDSQLGDRDLQQLLQSVENALGAEDGRDPMTGKHWTRLIDLDSWATKFLVEEIFGNGDGGAISQYFYGTAEEGVLYAGPVWDYDISMGNSQAWRVQDPGGIFAGRRQIRTDISLSWYYEISQEEAFRDRMSEIYRTTFLPLLDTFLTVRLEDYVFLISEAAAMNQLRWEIPDSVPAEAEKIRSFMEQRIAFCSQLWLKEEPFLRVTVNANDGTDLVCFGLRPGEQIPALPEYEPSEEILGWYAVGAEEPFDRTQPIYEDTELLLRRAEPEPAGEEPAAEKSSPGGFSMQYAPPLLLLAILGLCRLADRKRQRSQSPSEPGKIRS